MDTRPLEDMNKNEVFQFVNKLNNLDISTMIFRETVFDIISFGKANKIHLATTASLDRIKHVLTDYNLEIAPDEKDTLKFTVNNDTCYIHSIFKMSYDDFVKKMVATDLTFNSLLMKPDGQIYDMYGGLEDLKNKRLRFVDSFNEKNKTRLVLNCIRYIFKNGFTYDDAVKDYIATCLPSFTKSEKSSALFYLVEYINKEGKNADIELLLNNAFFKNEKTPNVDIGDYASTIANIGKEKYIYLLLILANININKSRFSTLIDADDFNDIKEAFALNLCDEMTYYDLKDKRGYEYLSHIISLQKEYAKLTKTEYNEPIFHKETVFDLIEQSEKSSTFTDDYILEEENVAEKIQLPKKDAFDLPAPETAVNYDFSSIFADDSIDDTNVSTITEEAEYICETFEEETFEDIADSESDNTESVDEKFSNNETNSAQELQQTEEEHLVNLIIDEQEKVENTTSTDDDTSTILDIDSLFGSQDNATPSEKEVDNDVPTETAIPLNEPDAETNKNDKETFSAHPQNNNDDIASLLSESEERSNFTSSKRRNINPRFKNKKETSASEQTSVVPSTEKEVAETIGAPTSIEDTVPATPVIFDNPSFATMPTSPNSPLEGELHLDEMFATKQTETPPVTQPFGSASSVNEEKPKPKEDKKSSLIDDIFEEEVKTPEISLSPEFDALISEVEKESATLPNDQLSQRQTVSETMMSDVVEVPEDNTPVNLDISEHELEEILAELNGKRKNSFIDDDEVAEETEDVTANFANSYSFNQASMTTSSYAPQNPQTTSSSDDDFFKSLNDDFTEIIGGNN